MHLVYHLCSQHLFDEVLSGLSLFPVVPLLPMKHFMAALKYYCRHMFRATREHLTQFEDTLDKEIKRSESLKESISTSTSSNAGMLLASSLDLDLLEKMTQSAIMALLRSFSTSFERERLLDLLIRLEIDDDLSWIGHLRMIRRTYELLGEEADACINWLSPVRCFDLPSVDTDFVLNRLTEDGNWTAARKWAQENDISSEELTKRQAEALVQEWEDFDFEEDMLEILWDQINNIFLDQSYPYFKAGLFFLQQAAQADPDKMKRLLLEAMHWVDGSKTQHGSELAPHLVEELRKALYLMDSERDFIHHLPNKARRLYCRQLLMDPSGVHCCHITQREVSGCSDGAAIST